MIGPSERQYVADYLGAIPEAQKYHGVPQDVSPGELAARMHLVDPSTPAAELSAWTNLDVDNIKDVYADLRTNDVAERVMHSVFYPRRMMVQFAEDTLRDWKADPEYADRLLAGEPVAPTNLEVHATKGTCNYTCAMCLWSDKGELTYKELGLEESGLMQPHDWIRTFQNAQSLGTRRIIFSGGGEPLVNKATYDLIAAARHAGLKTQLYTNGFELRRATDQEWDEILDMEQIRFSMHSPTDTAYNRIVAMPEHTNALTQVTANIKELIARRTASERKVRIGIGFVTQALNHHQIEAMADFAVELGVDYIDLRQDEVDVTQHLNATQRGFVAGQLRSIRNRMLRGDFGSTRLTMSDDMTALANGIKHADRKVGACAVKMFRPAISPFGIVAPCDLRAEPRFSHPAYRFGNVRQTSLPLIIKTASKKDVPANCAQCMPSGRTINAIISKLIQDQAMGIHYSEQPFS